MSVSMQFTVVAQTQTKHTLKCTIKHSAHTHTLTHTHIGYSLEHSACYWNAKYNMHQAKTKHIP